MTLTHLDWLEAESIEIMREAVAESERPAMLYSNGKDSSVMLHLAAKAFYPSPVPFPLLHVDTGSAALEMIQFRDAMARRHELRLVVHANPQGAPGATNAAERGAAAEADASEERVLEQAVEEHGFDLAFRGVRRDDEKSCAGENIFSVHAASQPRARDIPRPELWCLYNVRRNEGENVRVFPLINWSELDVWQYIHREKIPVITLYFARERLVVERNGELLVADDERLPPCPAERPVMKSVRFRTVGRYPRAGAVESHARTAADIVDELWTARKPEPQERAIGRTDSRSTENRDQEGCR